jgi:hypothetical protein
MSRQLALDTIRLRPTRQIAHTEYSLGYHPELVRKFTGLAPDEPGALRAFYDRWGLDFNWSSHDGLHAEWARRGRATDMGHAVYAADGADQREAAPSPFRTPEEVWAFDAVAEYGLPDFDEQVSAYEALTRKAREDYPEQLTTGGYYKTLVSGAIQAFGWDMLLTALSEPARMEPVFDSLFRFTRHHMQALARTSAEVIIQHDDFVWTEGGFMRPDLYRELLIPRYAELFRTLKAAGKTVLFCSDGNFMEYAEDIVRAGADGLIFEPFNDFDWMAERFGQSHCLIGSHVDCRTLTFGTWDEVRAEMDRSLASARSCRGVIFCTGNHLPGNIPGPMMERYLSYFLAHRDR